MREDVWCRVEEARREVNVIDARLWRVVAKEVAVAELSDATLVEVQQTGSVDGEPERRS